MASKRNKKSKSIPPDDPPSDKPVEAKADDAKTTEETLQNGERNEPKIFAPDDPSKSWVDEFGAKHMGMFDVLRIERLASKIEALAFQSTTLVLESNEKERLVGLKLRQMRGAAKNHDRQRGELEEEYSLLLAQLGEKHGVDFKSWGYDDENGKLTDLSEPKETPPSDS